MSITLTTSSCQMYTLRQLSRVRLEALHRFFDALPLDPYLEEKYRYRRFSRLRLVRGELVRLPHVPFVQRREHNPLLGEVVREYAELDDDLTSAEDFRRIVRGFLDQCAPLADGAEVGIHQIRIISERDLVGRPAPEGVHLDGFDYTGIFCVARRGIHGGETYLYESKEGEPIYRALLEPGDLLVFNDRSLYHYTTPVFTSEPRQGRRDVFILTAEMRPP